MTFLIFFVLFASCREKPPQRTVVQNVDLKRYAGTWYEIARYPHRFERGLAGVTATYTLRADGSIDVLNQGFRGSPGGKLSQARARARVPDPAIPGKLKVWFFPLFGADYLILDLDRENYQYALVGSSSMNYLWILSRTPVMDPQVLSNLKQKASQMGYDLDKLEMVPHKTL